MIFKKTVVLLYWLVRVHKLRIAGGERGERDGVAGRLTLGRVCATVSSVNCLRLTSYRPAPLKQ